jgi:DNA modification methylase
MVTIRDVFGNKVEKDILLRDKFIEPPFSVLDTKTGSWQARKRQWKRLGIQSEVSRENVLKLNQFGISYNNNDTSDTQKIGTSIFDPALCEVIYHWFCKDNGTILDPFAGGSVRGIVANYLGYKYTGIELREEQVNSNIEQGEQIVPHNQPIWLLGDSNIVLDTINDKFDMLFTCPPYFDLEVYSDLEEDLSNMDWDNFTLTYNSIISKASSKIKDDGFCVIVVGDIRDKKTGFYRDFISTTKQAFYKCGWRLYNEAILLESGRNTAAMRANRYMKSKKLVKVHQNVLVFKKG